MFLLPRKQTPRSEQVIEYILYMLWDTGLKAGYATRNIDEAIHIARENMTVRTTLPETRFLTGNRLLFDELTQRFETDVIKGTAADFIRAKLIERDKRHKKPARRVILLNPTLKKARAASGICRHCSGSRNIIIASRPLKIW